MVRFNHLFAFFQGQNFAECKKEKTFIIFFSVHLLLLQFQMSPLTEDLGKKQPKTTQKDPNMIQKRPKKDPKRPQNTQKNDTLFNVLYL